MTEIKSDHDRLANNFRNPSLPAKMGFVVIVVFLAIMFGWGALAPLSSAVVANGVLQAEGGRQSVQHPYGGVVDEIFVAEGDAVASGQVLLRLDDTEPKARYQTLAAERFALLATQGRVLAEREGSSEPKFSGELLDHADEPAAAEAISAETSLLKARLDRFNTQTNLLTQQAKQLDDRLSAIETQLAGLNDQRQSIEAERADAQALLEQQLVERVRVTTLERQLIDIDAQIGVLQTDANTAEKAKVEAELEAEVLLREREAEASAELRSTEARLAELLPQLNAAFDALQRVEIRAPADGRVVGQSVLTKGGVISAGNVLMTIAPLAQPYVVEAQMRLADITSVEEGATADLRLLAIPASRRPKLTGTINTISADRVVNERTGESHYALRIALDQTQVDAAGLDLQAGMPVQVIVPTTPRTMLDYLISPLTDELNGALREQ